MRRVSNNTIKYFIENVYKKSIKSVTLNTIIFDNSRMSVTIYLNNEFINFVDDIISVKNDMVKLQEEIKELQNFFHEEFGVVAEVKMNFFSDIKLLEPDFNKNDFKANIKWYDSEIERLKKELSDLEAEKKIFKEQLNNIK